MNTCTSCPKEFKITDSDRKYYERLAVPEPTLCPDCRSQRRIINTNHINLYKRKFDATGKEIISVYHEDSPLKVYDMEYFHSDKYDASEHGRDYDFNRPFFEQFEELANEVARPSLVRGYQFDENSDYTNYAGKNKNCYMIFDSDNNWDCYYSYGITNNKNCMDCYRVSDCELSYECVDVAGSYGLYYSQDCGNCSESAFLKNCIGCKQCFMCSNLKNKQYYIYNVESTKEEYERLMKSLSQRDELERLLPHWEEFKLKYPQKYMHGFQNENVSGDYLVNCKNAEDSYDCFRLWDCKYMTRSVDAKDCMDVDEGVDGIELNYESAVTVYNSNNCKFCVLVLTDCNDLEYSIYCNYSSFCFGCFGLQRKKHCILNKQYSEEEYEELVPKIIEHMKSTGEYGEFFPMTMADFGYNESVAMDWFPLTKEEALEKGLKWRDPDKKEYLEATVKIDDENICDGILACDSCKRNYKIVEQEAKLYKQFGIPVPSKCFYCRNQSRFDMRNSHLLHNRKCDKCNVDIQTTYSEEMPHIVYCEPCYQESLE